jgi:hypothetical protein
MVEIERNPLAVRQGAATIMCLAAAAVAMPVISHRAAEQRDGAEWAATSSAFAAQFEQGMLDANGAEVQLTAFRTDDGLRARGQATLFESPDARAMMVQAVLRGPTASQPAVERSVPAQPQIDTRQHDCLSQAIYYRSARREPARPDRGRRSHHEPRSLGPLPELDLRRRLSGLAPLDRLPVHLHLRWFAEPSPRGRAWDRAQRVATAVMSGYTRPITQGATHYHTHAVNPVWNSGFVETTSIESHVFYRFPNRSERAHYQEALARRRGAMGSRRSVTAASKS